MTELVYKTPVLQLDEEGLVARIAAAALVIQEDQGVYARVREATIAIYNVSIADNGANFEQRLYFF